MRLIPRMIVRSLSGLQVRTTLLLTCVVLLAAGLTALTHQRMFVRLALSDGKRHARELARTLADSVLDQVARGDRAALLRVAQSSVANEHLSYLMFSDTTGDLLASCQNRAGLVAPLLLSDGRTMLLDPIDKPQLLDQGRGPHIDVVYPVARPRQGDDGRPGPTVGFVRLGMSMARAEASLAKLHSYEMGLIACVALLMVPLGYEVFRRLFRPIQRLSCAARELASGKLEVRVEIDGIDEIGELSRSFNSMADELSVSHNQLVELNAELEDRVLQRTQALEEANRQLREMASQDSLTGLYNRRHFNDLLAQTFAESSRYGTDLTCMMIDLDDFKKVNDSVGHQVGDQLLQLAGRVIRESIRESDVAVRYGGDEFAVLLPQTAPDQARASAERILKQFNATVQRELPDAAMTSLSIGLASRQNSEQMTAREFVNLADEALYLAKAAGKNQITMVCPSGSSGASMHGTQD